MLLIPTALAASLPTVCPTVSTGEEVADYRAEIVAPKVVSVSEPLHALRDTWGDATCPSEDGSPCTSSSGASFEGTHATSESIEEYYDEGWDCGDYTGTDVVEVDLSAEGLDGANVAASGRGSYTRMHLVCGETDGEEWGWNGALGVTGRFEELEDDALDGQAAVGEYYVVSTGYGEEWSWDGTSGDCTWTAESVGSDDSRSGSVTVDGHTVAWSWLLEDGLGAYSITTVDGVVTGYAHWAADGLYDVDAWVDADGDHWSSVRDCDDSDPTIDNEDNDCDHDGDSFYRDCDDFDPSLNRYATEICGDGIDQDCDGSDDTDCDGYDDDDCDDADPAVYPGATELRCNPSDEDCDGDAADQDCDAFDDQSEHDCDDLDATRHPWADEIGCDGIDQDCDLSDGEDCDGDGFEGDDDCDEGDASVNPDAREFPGDGVDQDCDGEDGIRYCGCRDGAAWLLLLPLALRRR